MSVERGIIMSKIELKAKLIGNMAFATNINGHTVITDADQDDGGNNLGPRPKALLLSALVGCMGYDIMHTYKRMRLDIDSLNVDMEAETRKEDPKIYNYINLLFRFKGKDLPMDKLKKAIDLSHDKYCGVSAMLEKAVPINIEVVIED